MKIFCLLALLGAACALQPNYQYEYLYRGVVATGIPGIRPQVSGTGIKAKLVLQMKNSVEGIAQLRDIQVGEYHDDMKDQHLRKPLPIQYSPMSQYAQQLEQPFSIKFGSEMDKVLEVSSEDMEWLTNIRKSVIQMLHIQPLNPLIGEQHPELKSMAQKLGHFPPVFSLEEETLFGRCESQYTITPLRHVLKEQAKQEIERHLERDVQKFEYESDEYYKLVRAIDFSKCHDRVMLQFTSAGNFSQIGSGQFHDIQSRSSIGTYILKGNFQKFRVEQAEVNGAIVVNPYGIETDKIQARTNQTLYLQKVGKIEEPLRLPSKTKEVKTWRYTVVSPYSAGEQPKPWMKYQSLNDKYFPVAPSYILLGMKPTQEMITRWKKTVYQLIEEVAQKVSEIPQTPSEVPPMPSLNEDMGYVLVYKLFEASRIMRNLPVPQVEQLFTQIFQDESKNGYIMQGLLPDVVAASGAAAPYKVLLEKMMSGKLSDIRMFSLFPPLTIHLNNPIVLPELLRFVKSLNPETHPFLTSSAHINFANLVNRICMTPHSFNYTLPNELYGNQVCDTKLIVDDFIPYLKQKLHSVDKFYQKAIYTQALALVGSPHVLDVLRPVIMGQVDSNPRLRIIAINGLVRQRMPESFRNEVFNILMELVEKLDEEPVIREAAFTALLTWRPSPAWWTRMGQSTWKEPSRQMAAFISVTLESLSQSTDPYLKHQATLAKFALRLAKPMAPSFKYAFNFIYDQYDPTYNMATFAIVEWLQDFRSQIPTEIWTKQTQVFGGMIINWGDAGLSQEGMRKLIDDLLMYFKGVPQQSEEQEYYRQGGARSSQYRRGVQSIRSWIETRVSQDLDLLKGLEDFDALFFIRGWTNIHNMYPINKEVFDIVLGTNFMNQITQGIRLNITKFFNTAENEYFIPTEIGLPLTGQVSRPLLLVAHSDIKLNLKKDPVVQKFPNFEVLFKTNTKKISKILVRLGVMVPWNQKKVEVGLSQTHEFNTPVYGNFSVFVTPFLTNMSLNLSPYVQHKMPVVYFHNIPYTAIRSFVPTKNEEYKVITVRDTKVPLYNEQVYRSDMQATGIEAYVKYVGDVKKPTQVGIPFEFLSNVNMMMTLLVSPTTKLWQASFVVDPSRSQAKNVSLSLGYLDLSPRYQKYYESEPVKSYLEKEVSYAREMLQSERQLSSDVEQFTMYGAQLQFNSTRFYRRNSISMLKAVKESEQERNMKQYNIRMAAATDYCPYEKKPVMMAMKLNYFTPNITNLRQLKEKLSQNIEEHYEGELLLGENNQQQRSIARFNGRNQVTQERKSIVLKELRNIENFDKYDPTAELSTASVYDKGQFEMKYEHDIPEHLLNFTSHIDTTTKGMMFPYVSSSNVQVKNQENTYRLSYFRPISDLYYSLYITKPRENVIVTNLYIPFMFNTIVPSRGLLNNREYPVERRLSEQREGQYKQPSYIEPAGYKAKCNISIHTNMVKTFDGVEFPYVPKPCYTYVLKKMNENIGYYEVLTRFDPRTDTMYTRVVFQDKVTIVEFTYTKVWVKGQYIEIPVHKMIEIKDSNKRVLMNIGRLNETLMTATLFTPREQESLEINLVRESISLLPLNYRTLHNKIRGICGDYDGLTKYDKTGPAPANCLYTDNELFNYAWMEPLGNGCDVNFLEKKKEEVKEFTKHCRPRPSDLELMETKYQWVYPVKIVKETLNGRPTIQVCVSEKPIKRCNQENQHNKSESVRRISRCWTKGQEPKEVTQVLESQTKYFTHPINYRQQHTFVVSYEQDVICH